MFLFPIPWPRLNCLTGVEAFESKNLQLIICLLESLDATIPAGVKHVDSDGSGIFSLGISDAASFPGLSLEARAHDRTIRGWWWT